MNQERPIITDDGEFIENVGSLIAESSSVKEIGDTLHLSEKQRRERMLFLMSHLEANNIKGLPPLYVTAGSGKERVVICTLPAFKVEEREDGLSVLTEDYLILFQHGFFAIRFTGEEKSQLVFDDLRNLMGPSFSCFRKDLLGNSDKKNRLEEVNVWYDKEDKNFRPHLYFYSSHLRDKLSRAKIVKLQVSEFEEEFTQIQTLVKEQLSVAHSQNESVVNFVNNIVGEEKPKRKRGFLWRR